GRPPRPPSSPPRGRSFLCAFAVRRTGAAAEHHLRFMPFPPIIDFGGGGRNRTGVHGFAGRKCIEAQQELAACFSIGFTAIRKPVASSTAVKLLNSGLPDFESIL